MHERHGPHYPEVFQIIFDEKILNADTAEKIIDLLFPSEKIILEAILETLDKSLNPLDALTVASIPNFDLIKSKLMNYQIGEEEKTATVETFINTQLANQTNCETPGYIQSVTYLRIALLGS